VPSLKVTRNLEIRKDQRWIHVGKTLLLPESVEQVFSNVNAASYGMCQFEDMRLMVATALVQRAREDSEWRRR
jgi:hypothetical protein